MRLIKNSIEERGLLPTVWSFDRAAFQKMLRFAGKANAKIGDTFTLNLTDSANYYGPIYAPLGAEHTLSVDFRSTSWANEHSLAGGVPSNCRVSLLDYDPRSCTRYGSCVREEVECDWDCDEGECDCECVCPACEFGEEYCTHHRTYHY